MVNHMPVDALICDNETLNCNTINTTIAEANSRNVAIKHDINRTVTANINGVNLIVLRTKRDFSLTGTLAYAPKGNARAVYGIAEVTDEFNPNGVVVCEGDLAISDKSSSVSENVSITTCYFHFIDLPNNIAFFERRTDSLKFTVTSDEIAWFRTRWGSFKSHELIIPSSAKALRRKEFVIIKNGVERVLSDESDYFSVMPETTGAISTGGLGGSDISQAELQAAQKVDVSQIGVILCVPQPPTEATATELNPEILRRGFYDYLLMGESLQEEDGGMDFFYPAWCRNMSPDLYWQVEAKARFGYSVNGDSFPSTIPIKTELQWELAPQCSYAKHPVEGEMWSWAFVDGKGVGRSFSEINGVDTNKLLSKAIAPGTLATNTVYTPISLV